MLNRQQADRFASLGAVTVDTPFLAAEIDGAAAVLDRLFPAAAANPRSTRDYRMQATNSYFEPELLNLIQHPFLESAAQMALNAETVDFFATAAVKTFPEPGATFGYWEHVDIKYRLSDLDAAPRNMICSCLIWLTDVTLDRAPLMFRPASHRQIAAEMEKNAAYIDNPVETDQLPKLPYADPQPLLAKKGQLTVCTTSLIHGASCNTGTLDRKVIFITFVPHGYTIRANMAIEDKRQTYLRELQSRLRPERRHIIHFAAN